MASETHHRNTPQREVILEELRKTTSHPTAAGLYDLVRRRLPNVSLGTVYRNLELLARMGTIRKLDCGRSQARFDGNPHPHDHVRCVGCGRVDDLAGPTLDLSAVKHNDCHGYEILDYYLQFVGICPHCRGRPATSRQA